MTKVAAGLNNSGPVVVSTVAVANVVVVDDASARLCTVSDVTIVTGADTADMTMATGGSHVEMTNSPPSDCSEQCDVQLELVKLVCVTVTVAVEEVHAGPDTVQV